MKFILNGRLTEYNILISFFDSNFIDICSTIHHDSCSFSWLRPLVASEICNALIIPRIIKIAQSWIHSSWNSPGHNTGMSSHSFLLGDLHNPRIRLKPGLSHCRWILYHLSYQGSPKKSPSSQIDLYFQTFLWIRILLENSMQISFT